MRKRDPSWVLFSGSSHRELAVELASVLGVRLGNLEIKSFPDGEIGVLVHESVRGKDVFLLQSIVRRPNHYLMELLIIVDALKRASVKSIVAVLPYYGYARQDRKESEGSPVTARLVANLLERAGVTRVVTVDLHAEQIQGFFDIPLEELCARPVFVNALNAFEGFGRKDLVVVSPDAGRIRTAEKFAEDLGSGFAIIDTRRASIEVGGVCGKNVLLVDDIVSTGATLAAAVKACKKSGASSVFACVTHAVMTDCALDLSGIEQLVVTDTVPGVLKTKKITRISVAPLLGQAIERLKEEL